MRDDRMIADRDSEVHCAGYTRARTRRPRPEVNCAGMNNTWRVLPQTYSDVKLKMHAVGTALSDGRA
jgi:hypothetical protein